MTALADTLAVIVLDTPAGDASPHMTDWLATTPKVELHCHCDGCVDPAMLRALDSPATPLDSTATALERAYPVTSLDHWMMEYEPILADFWSATASATARVALHQYRRWCAQNVQYAELFVSRMLGTLDGEPLREWFRALSSDLRSAPGDCTVNLLVCLSRDKVLRNQQRILDLASSGLIVGVALAGNESACHIRDIAQALELFRSAGLGIEIHTGEFAGPHAVRDAIEYGAPNRIGHGVRAFEDHRLVDKIAELRIHLEFCPTSNLRLGVIPTAAQLPVATALAAGVDFSINTDDPGVFQCSVTSELALVQETFSLSDSEMQALCTSPLRAAFQRTG